MSYTMSFDASPEAKIKNSDKKGLRDYVDHLARDIDERNGIKRKRNNPNIRAERTKDNSTIYYNAEKGDFEACTDKSQIHDALRHRLDCVKKFDSKGRARPIQQNAVIVRGLVLQLDPKLCEDLSDSEIEDASNHMIEWVIDEFGKENIIAVSLHLDEGEDDKHEDPHIHVMFCPVTPEGKLEQTYFFQKPKDLREMHDRLRQHMIDNGYDIDMMRKPKRKRLNENEYRDYKGLEQANEEFNDAVMDMQAESQIAQMFFNQERSEELGELAYLKHRARIAKRYFDREKERLQDAVDKADGIIEQLDAYKPDIQYGENAVVDAIKRMAPTTYDRMVSALGLDAQKIVQKQIAKPKDALSELKREFGINSRETDRFMNENSQKETEEQLQYP